jgi:hypothetical protein
MLKVLDLFSGIGGFSLGLERTGGFKTTAFCEIDPFCRRALDMDGTVAKILWPDDLRIKSPTAHVSGVNYFITAGNFRAAAKALPSGHQAVKSPSPTPPAEGD